MNLPRFERPQFLYVIQVVKERERFAQLSTVSGGTPFAVSSVESRLKPLWAKLRIFTGGL
jgi:hypothetical protein